MHKTETCFSKIHLLKNILQNFSMLENIVFTTVYVML